MKKVLYGVSLLGLTALTAVLWTPGMSELLKTQVVNPATGPSCWTTSAKNQSGVANASQSLINVPYFLPGSIHNTSVGVLSLGVNSMYIGDLPQDVTDLRDYGYGEARTYQAGAKTITVQHNGTEVATNVTQDPLMIPLAVGTNTFSVSYAYNYTEFYTVFRSLLVNQPTARVMECGPVSFTVIYTPPSTTATETTNNTSTATNTDTTSTTASTTTSRENTTGTTSSTATSATTTSTPPSNTNTAVSETTVATATTTAISNEVVKDGSEPREGEGGGAFPEISKTSRIEPPMSYPGGEVTFQVFVTDADGIDTLSKVDINLFPIKGPRLDLTPKNKENDGRWYERTYQIPVGTPSGTYSFEIYATDKSGKSAFAKRPLTIVYDKKNVKVPVRKPVVQKIYTDPEQLEVGVTKTMYLYAEIRDEDTTDDIQAVNIDLSGLGREQTGPMAKVEDIDRFTALYAYKFKDADYISPLGSELSFTVESIDTENQRDKQKGTVTLFTPKEEYTLETQEAQDQQTITGNAIMVTASESAVSAVGENILELALPIPLHMASFRSSGQDVRVAKQDDIGKLLPVSRAVLNATGTVVRLYTRNLVEGQRYAVWMGDGARVGSGSTVIFQDKPVITYRSATSGPFLMTGAEFISPSTLRLTTNKPLVLSSVLPMGSNCVLYDQQATPVKIYHPQQVAIEEQNSLLLSFGEVFDAHVGYRLECRDLQEAFAANTDARKLLTAPVRFGSRFSPFDLNGDGQVSILDFTIFTSDYALFTLTR